jgi:rifampicin phosphotransferase
LNELVYIFPGSDEPPLVAAGGKGLSLIRTARVGLPVPPGLVLSVAYFEPWFEQLRRTPQWAAFLKAGPAELERVCTELKSLCPKLELSPEQKTVLKEALQKVGGSVFAVRSSSPEEDLEGASFAGGYETVLGVTPDKLVAAMRRTFASCLDYRVAVYKKEHGFDVSSPRIALVVQRQIASDVAGVGFSIDPISNDYDRAVFNANWGLGETVVAGTATPDTYVVDKVRKKIILRHAGKKGWWHHRKSGSAT